MLTNLGASAESGASAPQPVLIATLAETFPTVVRLLEDDGFQDAARIFLEGRREERPGHRHGAGFAEFLEATARPTTPRCLGDAARFDWALAEATDAHDAPELDLSALAEVQPPLFDRLRFIPHPSLRFIRSNHPVDRLRAAAARGADLSVVPQINSSLHFRILRTADGIEALRISITEFVVLGALASGASLGQAAQHAWDADLPGAADLSFMVARAAAEDCFSHFTLVAGRKANRPHPLFRRGRAAADGGFKLTQA